MNMTMQYKKKQKLRTPDSRSVLVGEDGIPYADDGLLLVADGLGGRGGYAHTKINPDICDPSKFYDVMFAPVLREADDEFKNYCLKSFSELFEIRDVYFTLPCLENQRTSGYFASRIVSAIVLNEFKFNPEMSRKAIFDAVYSEDDDEKRFVKLKEYGDKLTQTVKEKLEAIATNVGLELESKTTGSYLLPTTLVATLLDEHDDYVNALYFWAGDSRGYMWDKDGLAQVTEDHETGGTMTNLITLTKPFVIETRMLRVKKPCVLFNTSDGCYTPPCFASPFDIECLFLQSALSANDFDGMSKQLYSDYGDIATDDSDTMALTAFGYKDYGEFKNAAAKRWRWIEENVKTKLPDILDVDYVDELENVDRQIGRSILVIKDKLPPIDGVRQFVVERIQQTNYPPFSREKNALQSKFDAINAVRDKSKDKIAEWVTRYWMAYPCLKKYALPNFASNKKDPFDEYRKCKIEVDDSITSYNNGKDELLEEFENSFREIMEKSRECLELTNISENYPEKNLMKMLEYHRFYVNELTRYARGRGEYAENYSRAIRRLNEIDDKNTKMDGDLIRQFADAVMGGGQAFLDAIEMSDDQKAEVTNYLQQLEECAKQENDVLKQMNELADKFFDEYWKSNVNALVGLIWKERRDLIPQEILNEVSGDIAQLNEKRNELCKYLEIRQEIYDDYEKEYLRVYERSALL